MSPKLIVFQHTKRVNIDRQCRVASINGAKDISFWKSGGGLEIVCETRLKKLLLLDKSFSYLQKQ